MPLVEFRILCSNAGHACDLVQKMTPFEEGYTVRRSTMFDDFDHIALRNFNTIKEAQEKRKVMIKESDGKILEHQLVVH